MLDGSTFICFYTSIIIQDDGVQEQHTGHLQIMLQWGKDHELKLTPNPGTSADPSPIGHLLWGLPFKPLQPAHSTCALQAALQLTCSAAPPLHAVADLIKGICSLMPCLSCGLVASNYLHVHVKRCRNVLWDIKSCSERKFKISDENVNLPLTIVVCD